MASRSKPQRSRRAPLDRPAEDVMTTIVQITDTHATAGGRLAYGRIDVVAALRRAAAHIRALPERLGPIDAVIATGDLADSGRDDEYLVFREAMADLPAPLYVLPGNHDDRAALRRAFPEAAYLPAGDGPLDYAVEIGALLAVALDTTIPGETHGALTPAQLDWLEDALANRATQPTVVFLHHPPFQTGVALMDPLGLRNGAALLARLRAHPQVRLVASGHVHRMVSTVVDGVPCMIAPSPAHAVCLDTRPDAPPSVDAEPGAVVAHLWRAGALTSHVSYIDAFGGPYRIFGTADPD